MRVPRIPEKGIRSHELELQEVVNSPRRALGTELGSSEGVMHALFFFLNIDSFFFKDLFIYYL